MRTEFAKLLKLIRKNIPEADEELVRKAYREADNAHRGQTRLSGEPYVAHCIAVARILAQLSLDTTTIAAALLHDVIEDTKTTRNQLAERFSDEIADLVDGVTKFGALHISTHSPTPEEQQAQNLRKMLMATAKDVRVILIKLADRLHNMRTITYLPPDKIQRISKETLEIYAPLANRLGISQWRWELEDHAFHQLNPIEYKRMAAQVESKRREREAQMQHIIAYLTREIQKAGVSGRVQGRAKHLYGIYQKMLRQGIEFDSVMDIRGLRVITGNKSDCYTILGIIHNIWTPIPNRFKDYIAMPKENMYQSIHTAVMGDDGKAIEIQIRSEEMDRTAHEGIAAHWRYKEGKKRLDPVGDTRVESLRKMYEWLKDARAPEEFMDGLRRDFQTTEVYVFTPKGDVKELPLGATPLDFAYAIHSDIGHHCIGAYVNKRIVPLRYHLQTGDVVEILTSKNQTPHRDWMDFVVTGKARNRIRQRLRELEPPEPAQEETKPAFPRAATPLHPPQPTAPPVVRTVDEATRQKLLRVEGMRSVAAQFAKCCNPMPGHPIIGYATRNPGISIHRRDCNSLARYCRDKDRLIIAYWEGEGVIETRVRITLSQRPNVLADLTNAMRPMNVDITKGDYQSGENGTSFFEFVFESPSQNRAERVVRTLRTVAGVMEARIIGTQLRDLKP